MSHANVPAATDDRRLEAVRAAFPLTSDCTYLNTAALGPVSAVYRDVLARCTDEDVRRGRAVADRFRRIDAALEAIRAELAIVLGCTAQRLTLTRSTRDGIEQVLSTFDWQPGDEVVSTSIEHVTCTVPLERETARAGVALRIAAVPPGAPDDLEWLTALITPRTRLLVFSVVGFETGVRLPLAAIAAFARERGILTLVDAAQAAGAIELGIESAGIDFCAAPLQKWLAGPEGLGALCVSDAGRTALTIRPMDSVRHGVGILEATAAHLEWMRRTLGWDWVYARTAELTRQLRTRTAAESTLSLVDSGAFAGISTIRSPATGRDDALVEIAGLGFAVRHLPNLGAFRISNSFFNNDSELDDIVSALSRLS